MKINSKYKLRNVAGEHLILLPGSKGGEMSKVMAFNSSSKLLWDNLYDRDFSINDVQKLLLDNFDVSDEVALHDAEKWVQTLKDNGIIFE